MATAFESIDPSYAQDVKTPFASIRRTGQRRLPRAASASTTIIGSFGPLRDGRRQGSDLRSDRGTQRDRRRLVALRVGWARCDSAARSSTSPQTSPSSKRPSTTITQPSVCSRTVFRSRTALFMRAAKVAVGRPVRASLSSGVTLTSARDPAFTARSARTSWPRPDASAVLSWSPLRAAPRVDRPAQHAVSAGRIQLHRLRLPESAAADAGSGADLRGGRPAQVFATFGVTSRR